MQSFPVSIHPIIRDKPAGWRSEFSCGWERRDLTLTEILAEIREGRALIFAGMTGDSRTSAAFESSSLLAVDVDHGASLQAFLDSSTPLRRACCAFYTTASHQRITRSNPNGEDRFRLLFQIREPITDGETYNGAVRLLISSLGGDASCSDCCRIFYGNRQALAEVLDHGAFLESQWIKQAAEQAAREREARQNARDSVEDRDIQRALWIFEHEAIPPTNDGERDRFMRTTAAAASFNSDAVFEAWQRWAESCHHSKVKRNTTRKYFNSFTRGTPNSFFHFADFYTPEWRDQLPEKLKPTSRSSNSNMVTLPKVAGYSADDFEGEDNVLPPATGGLIDYAGSLAKKSPSQSTNSGSSPEQGAAEGEEEDDEVKTDKNSAFYLDYAASQTFPGVRWNELQQRPEYRGGKGDRWIELSRDDAYIKMSMWQGPSMAAPAKVAAYDAALALAKKHPYNPAVRYLAGLRKSDTKPSPHFKTIASRYLGATEGPDNIRLANGRLYADVVMEKFMIAAVARAFDPGCNHDWMPVLIGAQGVGKTRFIMGMAPQLEAGAGQLCSIATGSLTKLAERPADLHQGWLVLLDEFERYSTSMGAGVEKLKAMISTSIDTSDRKYEQAQGFPRAFALIGSANSTTFLRDPTGNRRFKPVVCGSAAPGMGPIEVDLWDRERDELWKAAVLAADARQPHHFTSEENAQFADVIRRFQTESAYISLIQEACATGGAESYAFDPGDPKSLYYHTASFFDHMKVPPQHWQSMMPDIEKALESMGFVKKNEVNMVRRWGLPEDPGMRASVTFDPSHPKTWETQQRLAQRRFGGPMGQSNPPPIPGAPPTDGIRWQGSDSPESF